MYKLKTVENMVLIVLISTPDARDDDMRLYYYVCRDCISETHGNTHLSFEEVMTNYRHLNLPVVRKYAERETANSVSIISTLWTRGLNKWLIKPLSHPSKGLRC